MEMSTRNYVPCLLWKQGEYQALLNLSPTIRDTIIPLIDVAEIGYDFEERKDKTSIDEHLKSFAKRVSIKWGINDCFVDLHHIDPSLRMINGKHPVSFVFDDLRQYKIHAIPVTGIYQDSYWQDAIKNVINQDGRGVCFRINLESSSNPLLLEDLNNLFRKFGVNPEQCDFILDEKAPNFEPIAGFIGLLEVIIKNLPYLNSWRSFALIGTSIPPSLTSFVPGTTLRPRFEWQVYKGIIARFKSKGIRLPAFGDYAIQSPETIIMDPRFMKPKDNIRYSTSDDWLILRGKNERDLSEYKILCNNIVSNKLYRGSDFSAGDRYILDCAMGITKTGNHTTWRYVGTNHHLTLVVQDISNLDVF